MILGKGDKSSGSKTDPESYILKAMSHGIRTDRSLLNWSTVSGFCQIMSSAVVRVDRGYAGLSEPEVRCSFVPVITTESRLWAVSEARLISNWRYDGFVFQPLLLWTQRLIWRHETHFLPFPELTVMSLWMLVPTKGTSLPLQSMGCLGPSPLFHDTHPSHIWRHMTLNNRKTHADRWERTTVKP